MEIVRDRILDAVKQQHQSYLQDYLSEKDLNKPGQLFDPVDLALFVCGRLQTDNEWLLDKLAAINNKSSGCSRCQQVSKQIEKCTDEGAANIANFQDKRVQLMLLLEAQDKETSEIRNNEDFSF